MKRTVLEYDVSIRDVFETPKATHTRKQRRYLREH